MFNFIKNKFVFILIISVVTLGALVFGAVTLYQEDSSFFSSDGYIIDATAKANKKYYFSANTEYKENVEDKIIFSDVDNNQVSVDPASFVHYSNGDVTFLKKGALVNLTEINSSMVNYYNITNQSTIKYENGGYVVSSNDKKISIESFIGRISDNKYLISGAELSLKVPQNNELISGDYFEILFIEDGVVKINNEKANYQVTAQDSYIYVGDDITIDLGSGRIMYDGEAKMLMSQITINNDENINLDVDDKNNSAGGGGGGGGAGSGTGEGNGDGDGEGDGAGIGADGEGTGEAGDGTGEGTGSGSGSGDGTGEGDGTGTGGTGGGGAGGTGIADATLSVQVELIEAVVTSTTIDLSLQLNNANLANGNLLYYFTNLSTGKREGNSQYIDLVNGTFYISQESLSPSTDYSFTIIETGGNSDKQYFQKTFTTKDLGITLEKVYASEDSLSYNLIFDENAEVTRARVSIFDENGSNKDIENNQVIISKEDINNGIVFEGLKSNTTYAVSVDMVWINNAAYSDVYSINRMDTTLKKTPVISGVTVSANAEEVKFDIGLTNVKDPDKSIEKYIYNIYLADDITVDNMNPVPVYSVIKNDSDNLVLNLNEIDELKTGVDYRCKIYAEYNDNEMVREVSTEYSGNFLIKSKPKISFELKSATMNRVEGILSLIDANCTVPLPGRVCSSSVNNFTLRYYKASEEEHNLNDRSISFDYRTLSTELELSDLESNTTYAVKLFGNYIDDDNELHNNVQIGDTFFVSTDKSDNIYFEVVGDNISGQNKDGSDNSSNVVTFDARLTAPQDSNVMEEISTITLNLYSGRYNVSNKLIGTYTINDRAKIEDFFNNMTITNNLFTDVTTNNLGLINSLAKMIKVTNNLTGTLNGSYTVEVADVFDSTGLNEITVENNVYTFNLTPSYYLDSRIETNPNETYITVTPITKENLTEDEYNELSKTVKNLDELKDDTVVGLIIENSLSDSFVNSAFTYEKVIVDYTIYNNTTNRDIKTISVDMGNKYQPKQQVVWLDSSELDDGKEHFTRGYKYRIGFNFNFVTEDGSNPTYTHDKLYRYMAIERQDPIYTQYIYSSNDEGITYRYSFSDIDNAIYNKNFYYTLGENKEYKSIDGKLKADGEYHEVVVPINYNTNYSLYYARRNTDDKETYVSMSNYTFEKEYKYDNSVSYSIIEDNSNTLKLKIANNNITSRAYAYKVVLKADGVDDYVRYFLTSKLGVIREATGQYGPEGEEIFIENKYIGIDYANIIDFMNHDIAIEVYCYYDSGLVGINQKFTNGMVLKNNETGKYINTYYQSGSVPTSGEDNNVMGIYYVNDFNVGDSNIFIYNNLVYDPDDKVFDITGLEGIKFDKDDHGINYGINYSSNGLVFSYNGKSYSDYNFRVLNSANLVASDNIFKFETVIPSISISTDNTINSINLNISTSGIYGNKQFVKDGKAHNKIYVDFYGDVALSNKLDTVVGDVTITETGSGYQASVGTISYNDLVPATTYYYTVSAYIDDNYTRLFDSSATKNNVYTYKDYETSTLGVKEIFQGIKFNVLPSGYNGDYAMNTLTWKLSLKNTKNYRIRFELYRPDGTVTSTDPETLEEIVTTNYKAVNFDGTDSSSCNIDSYGTSGNAYINGCYINIDKDSVSSINKKDNKYKFSNDTFVFGGNYYKLVVYAVPYTNGKYDEDNKLVLYQNDSLSTDKNGTVDITDYYLIDIPYLEEASFSLKNSLQVGYSDGYYISFTPTITDKHYVMKNGTYVATLKDSDGNVVDRITDITVGANKKITFNGLKSNTLYYIELSYNTYRNNIGFSDEEKVMTTDFTDFAYTPVANDITLGTITARQIDNKSITLAYNGSSNMSEKITKVRYTISLKGGSSKVSGYYEISSSNSNIFVVASDDIPRLTIDVSSGNSDNIGFNFSSGNTYIITTQYYYGDEILKDQETGNSTYTTILNL